MKRTGDGSRSRGGRALRCAVPAVAMLLVSCIAVPVPVPIPVVTGVRLGPEAAPAGAPAATTVSYDTTAMSAEQAESYARGACADEGATLDTLTRGGPMAAAPDRSTITYTCRR